MPGMKAVGTKTAERTSAMPMTGPETSSIALIRRIARRHAFLDVMLDGLHHDDGVIDHEADREHEAEKRERVDGEAEERKEREGADERNRHGAERDERRAPALQEKEDDQDHEHERLDERVHDLVHARA